jgi:hypothetical protein
MKFCSLGSIKTQDVSHEVLRVDSKSIIQTHSRILSAEILMVESVLSQCCSAEIYWQL